VLLLGNAGRFHLVAVLDGAFLEHAIACELQNVRLLLVGDALRRDGLVAGDAGGLDGASGSDLGLLQRAVALDL
jgi:hypothetical protein